MLSKGQIKLINSLSQKKYRQKNALFVAEGIKVIKELLNSNFELELLFSETDIFFTDKNKIQLLEANELKKITKLSTGQTALALFKIPQKKQTVTEDFIVALDGVRDPGNLGTIIRLCDWFGVKQLLCSNDTVDCYNEKVIQATMGSIARVEVIYGDLAEEISKLDLPVFGTFMNGENIYESSLSSKGILVLGNEANGISEEIKQLSEHQISIPQFGATKNTESLNVATATAILLSEFKRR
ncbi:RNA methyltransferase [Mesonia sp.]|uniref:TrmH family RNA methyltransferase n=1 Tax=Mesonia sp. TaxID=1960830 RepID=UPI001760F3B4|nr:RNA methyltransferase [Mesonia sp.]HIB38247.1 RNA methyltransferase [Mesonia sp.]HIO26530.1 RNA methyltransferase [Flavobacteriaceae bacterium]